MELKNARMDQMKKGVKMVSFYVSLLLSSSSNPIFLEWRALSLLTLPTWLVGPGGGGGHTQKPYVAGTGLCRWTGYGFHSQCPTQDI